MIVTTIDPTRNIVRTYPCKDVKEFATFLALMTRTPWNKPAPTSWLQETLDAYGAVTVLDRAEYTLTN